MNGQENELQPILIMNQLIQCFLIGQICAVWLQLLCCFPLSFIVLKGFRLLVGLKKKFVDFNFSSVNCEHFFFLTFYRLRLIVKMIIRLIPNENNHYMYPYYEDLNELIINESINKFFLPTGQTKILG